MYHSYVLLKNFKNLQIELKWCTPGWVPSCSQKVEVGLCHRLWVEKEKLGTFCTDEIIMFIVGEPCENPKSMFSY